MIQKAQSTEDPDDELWWPINEEQQHAKENK